MMIYDFKIFYFKSAIRSALCILFILFVTNAFSQEWKLRKEEDGIKVYTRLPPGADIDEVMATVRIKTNLSSFVALLKDVSGYVEWAYNCVESKLLKVENDTTQYYYTHTHLPWPVSDRDLIFRSSLKQDPVTFIVKTNSCAMPNMLGENDGIVRIRVGRSGWTLTPVTGGFVDVSYFATLDPGGSIPAWLVNSTIDTGPFYTLQSIRTLLEGGKYKDAEFWFVKEPEK